MEKKIYDDIVKILGEELLPAMGCTEPISVAYAAALARETLGVLPSRVEIAVSGNILKNVKSVIVPSTGGLKGISAAAAAGIAAGNASAKLEVLSEINDEDRKNIKQYLSRAEFCVQQASSGCIFDIVVKVFGGENYALVRIEGHHTNIIRIEKNGKVLVNEGVSATSGGKLTDRSILNIENIYEFATTANVNDFSHLIERQIEYNSAIADEGLKNDYGARVGKILLSAFGDDGHNLSKAYAAAGSDARMNGCSLPVIIVSGSGNQGMTASLPVVVYARKTGADREKTIRAVTLSDLVTIHLKSGIGRLSAYCGAVSAGAGAGAGICYLIGGNYEQISHTVVNTLAIDSGLICDGAKSSCAAKIASAVEAGLLGMEMSMRGSHFLGGDGILEHSVEKTIDNVCDVARIGMKETDEEIIKLMIKNI